jgi:hypothetical protein
MKRLPFHPIDTSPFPIVTGGASDGTEGGEKCDYFIRPTWMEFLRLSHWTVESATLAAVQKFCELLPRQLETRQSNTFNQ